MEFFSDEDLEGEYTNIVDMKDEKTEEDRETIHLLPL